mgnify:CR=1 FL=1
MIERLIEQLLRELGEDARREGLAKTPERVAPQSGQPSSTCSQRQ